MSSSASTTDRCDVHDLFCKWSEINWKETIDKKTAEISDVVEVIEVFDFWTSKLSNSPVGKKLFPEIFMDYNMSINFACMGLYKYAYMSLRSELETALRLIYFEKHPVEYDWWTKGIEIDGITSRRHVWGDNYKYFRYLDSVIEFHTPFTNKEILISQLSGTYAILSKYVHTSGTHFQTGDYRISPKFSEEAFNKWYDTFKKIQDTIMILLILEHKDIFQSANAPTKEKLLYGISYQKYRERIKMMFQIS